MSKRSGQGRVVTRAARRVITPAIEPGSIRSNADGQARSNRRLLNSLQALCNHYNTEKIPDFTANTRRLDQWLQSSLNDERTGFLSAFVDQASMIQSNLHYRITGAKSLVGRTLDLLHASEGGDGFRKLIKMTALNFYSSNFGGAVFLDRTEPVVASYLPNVDKWYWSTPPVEAMYATDSTLFASNNDYVYPFTYDGEPWSRYDFFRVVSMPSTVLKTWGIGRCPLYRCIQMARMTSALFEHVLNALSPNTAQGVITIKGMSGDEFLAAMAGSESVNEEDNAFRAGYAEGGMLGDIVVLADRDEEIAVKYVQLSRIPDGFFVDQWVRWTLTSFATNLGFPLDEFIGMPSGRLLGQSGAEVQSSATKGSTKGGADFKNSFNDALQAYAIPDSVLFQFADRDETSELAEISIRSAKAKVIIDLFEATQIAIISKGDPANDTLLEAKSKGTHVISRDEARLLLDTWDVLPIKLTGSLNADLIIDDSIYSLSQVRLKEKREQAMDTPQIRRLAANPTSEPVVAHDSWVDKVTGFVNERELVLWDDANELARPTLYRGVSLPESDADSTGPNVFKRRLSNKKVTKQMALESEHAGVVTRLLRKNMLAQAEASLGEFVPLREIVTAKDADMIIGRLYALVQMGRDTLIGSRQLSDMRVAELAGRSLQYAKDRWIALLGDGRAPEPTTLEETLDDEVGRMVEVTVTANQPDPTATITLDPTHAIMAALEEYIRPRAAEIGDREAGLAFEAGRYLASEIANIKFAPSGEAVV